MNKCSLKTISLCNTLNGFKTYIYIYIYFYVKYINEKMRKKTNAKPVLYVICALTTKNPQKTLICLHTNWFTLIKVPI